MKSSCVKTLLTAFLFVTFLYIPLSGFSQGDECSGAAPLTSSTSCSNGTYTLNNATASAGIPAGCTAGTHYDVWFSFVAASTTETVTISSPGSNITNPEVQIFSGSCGALTAITGACGATSASASIFTVGTTYYIRVSNVGSDPSGTGNRPKFSICVTHPPPPPSNDDCSGALSLTPATSCGSTSGTIISATASTGLPAGCESGGTHYDVWYSFNAASTYEIISISGLGSSFTNPELQLYSGTCGSLTSLQCGTTSFTATGLTVGATYYVRVSNVGTAITTNGGFNICVYHPAGATYDYGKSYVNITRGTGGGTINPGDTLEIRGTLVIRGQSLDSLAFFDTLYNGSGVKLVPGSIALRTNEGKVYKSFTDATGDDAGYQYTNGLDTVIRINMGSGASSTSRGRLSNTSKPSVFGASCIIMATYRVVVYANYGSTINIGGGAITYKDATTGVTGSLSFSPRNAIVYSSPGLCPNAVSATNAIGGDFNGTFGTPSGSAPYLRNRGTSTNVPSYIYKTFTSAGGPNDYYYGIANNTSQSFTTVTTWAKPDNSSPTHRVFNVWDITGDHTGASNTAKGNPPCDTTLPISATNPCGYMLIINSAYKTDTAFQYTVSNLCPNTYYEISAWLKNICYKCGCDSNGVGASGAGYIPFATNDSSGVQPNLAFDINGSDYYTTGNLAYSGIYPTTQSGSDSVNSWVKRGFTYLTGLAQTSLTLTIRNNAPGGGGNDWAMDDITLATCLPNMSYSPSLSPTTCKSNTITINDTIRSYFNNYTYYKWQRSSDNGSTWSDVTSPSGPSSPGWNGSAYQYITSYTIPPAYTTMSNNGDLYRVVVATTSSNLADNSCLVTDGVSIITLNVIDCGTPLGVRLISFTGNTTDGKAMLTWSTSQENEPLTFDIEKSFDGLNFVTIGTVNSNNEYNASVNVYSFKDLLPLNPSAYYRIKMKNTQSTIALSRTIQVSLNPFAFSFVSVINPFNSSLIFDVSSDRNGRADAELVDQFGKVVRKNSYEIITGANHLELSNTDMLPSGIYILRIQLGDAVLQKRVLKQKF